MTCSRVDHTDVFTIGNCLQLKLAWYSCFRAMCTISDFQAIKQQYLQKAVAAAASAGHSSVRETAAAMLGAIGSALLKVTQGVSP